ncbi:MAG: dehydrogenase [Elusimicrobia bacterium]|nr:dehydrogenase [Elusimicrobiota bacterium]
MAKVDNWQLNREMDYKFKASPPQRQIAWVFDTNKCIACQTCTVACKTTWTSGEGQEHMFWNNVESKPFGFYPLAWDVKILEKLKRQTWDGDTYAGRTIFEGNPPGEEVLGFTPEPEDWSHPNLGEDEVNAPIKGNDSFGLPHDRWMFYLARICNHCAYPACLAACPRKAIYKRKDDGIVLIDQSRCRGYQKCVAACPYKKPMFNPNTGRSEKCIACYPLIEKGIAPRCVQTCIGKIRMVGFINPPDKAREDNPLDFLVHVKKVALPLLPQLGTSPNVYYIPPIHVDTTYLTQMFGPGVKQAVEIYKARQEKIIGLLSLFGSTEHWVDRFEVAKGEAAAFQNDAELVRVPVKEPVVFRVYKDEKHGVFRQSVT